MRILVRRYLNWIDLGGLGVRAEQRRGRHSCFFIQDGSGEHECKKIIILYINITAIVIMKSFE